MSLKENDIYYEALRRELLQAIADNDIQREMEIRQELKDANFVDLEELDKYN